MSQASTAHTCCRSEQNTASLTRPSLRTVQSDAEYLAEQRKECSWSHLSGWGEAAAKKFIIVGQLLGERLYHDDKVADFGGNDGFAANEFYMIHKVKPMVVDCDPEKLEFAERTYGLPTCEAFIENLPLEDKSIDWGFCSHTLEHSRDLPAALREFRRVIKRGCAFIVPLEPKRYFEANHAHNNRFQKPREWVAVLEANGWKVTSSKRAHKFEHHMLAEPV